MTDVNLSLSIESGNPAFDKPQIELARILRALADTVESGAEGPFTLRDLNGKAVGSAFLEIDCSETED